MAKHEVVIHENTGATKESAPYLGSYIAKDTVKEPAFASSIATLCGMSAVQVMAILDGSFEAIEELELSGLVRVHTDVGTVCAVILGSFPTADAAFDKEKNSLELALRLDEEIRLALADVVPYIAQDGSLTKLRVDNVMDLETPKPYNLIHGQGVFRVAGFNMVLDDEGAGAHIENGMGTTFPLVIDEVVSKQLFKAHTAALLEAGDYKLVVKSRAGDAEGPLQTSFRKVKYLKVESPEPVIETVGDEGKLHGGVGFDLVGRNLAGATVKVRKGGDTDDLTEFATIEDEKIAFDDLIWNNSPILMNANDGDVVTFDVTTDKGSVSAPGTVKIGD